MVCYIARCYRRAVLYEYYYKKTSLAWLGCFLLDYYYFDDSVPILLGLRCDIESCCGDNWSAHDGIGSGYVGQKIL